MNYEAWRISYQSSEQAARAAFKAWQAATEQAKPTGGGALKGPGIYSAQRALSRNLETWPDDAHNAITDLSGGSFNPKGFVAKHKLDQVVEGAKRIEDMQAETIQRLRDDLRTAYLHQEPNESDPVWYWQGDDYDHLESMVNDAVVVMRADQLRTLLATNQLDQDQPQ